MINLFPFIPFNVQTSNLIETLLCEKKTHIELDLIQQTGLIWETMVLATYIYTWTALLGEGLGVPSREGTSATNYTDTGAAA